MKFPRSLVLWSVGLGHMVNDVFMSIGPVMLAFASAHYLRIGASEIGVAISVRELIGAVSQPFWGWLGDRTGGRIQAAGGVAWTATMMLLSLALSLTGQFWLTVIPYALAALGSGAFHPVGAMYAAEAKKEEATSNTAYFFLMGQAGLALGPAIAGILFDRALRASNGEFSPGSITPMFALALAVIPSVSFMALAIPRAQHRVKSRKAAKTGVGHVGIAFIPVMILVVLVLLRSVAHIGTVNFIPVLFQRKGWDPASYGLITSSYWLASAISGVMFGQLADRYDRRHVIALSLVLGAPALFLLPIAQGPIAFLLALISGALIGASFPIMVVLAQSLFPASKGFASGAILGGIFAAGALGSLVIGLIADGPGGTQGGGIGLEATFQVVAGLAVAASLIALVLPASMSGRKAQPVEAQ